MNPPRTGAPSQTLDALADVVGLMDGVRLAAEAEAQGDHLSPWSNVAMSAYLAAAGLRQLLPWPPQTRMVADCRSSLAAAAGELGRLDSGIGLPVEDVVLSRGWLATAIADVEHLLRP